MDAFSKLLQYFFQPPRVDTEPLDNIVVDLFKNLFQKADKTPKGGFLGIQVEQNLRGVEVAEVVPGYAAHRAGICKGDIIVEMGKQPIHAVSEMLEKMNHCDPGTKLEVVVLRKENSDWTKQKLLLTLDKRP